MRGRQPAHRLAVPGGSRQRFHCCQSSLAGKLRQCLSPDTRLRHGARFRIARRCGAFTRHVACVSRCMGFTAVAVLAPAVAVGRDLRRAPITKTQQPSSAVATVTSRDCSRRAAHTVNANANTRVLRDRLGRVYACRLPSGRPVLLPISRLGDRPGNRRDGAAGGVAGRPPRGRRRERQLLGRA